MPGSFFLVIIQHPGKMIKIRAGELAHRIVFDHFPGAGKARSASERPQSRMRSRWDYGVLNNCLYVNRGVNYRTYNLEKERSELRAMNTVQRGKYYGSDV